MITHNRKKVNCYWGCNMYICLTYSCYISSFQATAPATCMCMCRADNVLQTSPLFCLDFFTGSRPFACTWGNVISLSVCCCCYCPNFEMLASERVLNGTKLLKKLPTLYLKMLDVVYRRYKVYIFIGHTY